MEELDGRCFTCRRGSDENTYTGHGYPSYYVGVYANSKLQLLYFVLFFVIIADDVTD